MVLTIMFLSSCAHEALVTPIDPGPDPDPDPIDTTGNPIDTTSPGTPCDPNVVYFNLQILPLLKSNCAKSGCHDAGTHEEGIILDSYQNVMNSDVIKPFDLNDSELFEVITENDLDDVMPPPPNQRLNADQISLIASWILQGAKDLTCDENAGQCETNNVTYSGFVRPLLTTNCVGCHSGGAPSGGITLNTYDGVRSVALNGRLYGAINHSNGFQPMPRGSAKLPQCTIDKIKAWIDNGAQNN
ncbi:MAG TPA: c-type cytochrome domain-containing protein [Saprospiraceae bacterium]|nr:c-type cytochrome domain-containing protein [Saprospiraceae bacterium]